MTQRSPSEGPLAALRVLDFSRVLAGPACSMILGDLGADVVKVEQPGIGDETRHWMPPDAGGESAYFLCANRNKRGITLHLGRDRGREIAADLAAGSDVLLENFRVGWMEARGLGYEVLRERNPALIYASLSGFGQSGPDRHLPGYDFLIQARAGLMSITGDPGGPPTKVGVAVTDIQAGLYMAVAILAALRAREATGRGQRIDVSLMDAQVAGLANVASNHLIGGAVPGRYDNAHPNIVPYQTFDAADQPFALAVGNDVQWRRCCAAIDRPDWAEDGRFRTNECRVRNREALVALLAERFGTAPAGQWVAALRAADVPAGPVQDVRQVFEDPQVLARQLLVRVPHPTAGNVPMVASPIGLSETPAAVRRPPPLLGEHTEEVLRERLRLSDSELAALRDAGVT
jgi:formyl-CoA transferase